ncbi:probable RNA-directed DNA polymerase from transposon X-element [Trichonephila clavipes]|nr:probable RNA-directed DNA polymerase from transposon X-element [Trichonephila clavipes]
MEFKIFVEKYAPDLILIQETHLRPKYNINIPNYICYRNDRDTGERARGGTLILIRRNFPHYNLPTPPLQHIEATIVVLTPPNFNPISIASVYVPPKSDERLFTLDFEHLLQTNSNCVIFGDLNATHNEWNCSVNSTRGKQLKTFTDTLNLTIAYPSSPTRFGHGTSNTLDIAVINNFNFPFTMDSIPELSSDHNPGIRNPNVLEDKISLLTAAVCSAHQQASKPIENKKHSFTPNHIHELVYIKNEAKRLYNRTLNPIHRTNYYKAQANLKKALKKHSQQSWQTRLESLNTTDNSLWQCQKFFRKKRSSIPNLTSSSGPACSDDQKANLLAITLKDNFTENERPNGEYPIDNTITTTLENFFSHPPPLPIAPTDPDEVLNYIKTLSNNKAPGKDNITNKMVKHFPLKIILLLTFLINKILLLRHFPNNWKIAIVFPIKKPGKNSKSPSSYRPISLLSILSKITEHVILNRIHNFTDSINFINPNQYGFTRHLSTYHPLLRLTEKITSGFQRGRSTGAVFLDIQKAFDRVWTAETNSSPHPLSPSTSTNKETPSRKQANQHQAPNTLSMGRRNASRSSAQRCQATSTTGSFLHFTFETRFFFPLKGQNSSQQRPLSSLSCAICQAS